MIVDVTDQRGLVVGCQLAQPLIVLGLHEPVPVCLDPINLDEKLTATELLQHSHSCPAPVD